MIIMPRQERRAYLSRLRPYTITSLILFGAGIAIGLMVVSYFPGARGSFPRNAIAGVCKNLRWHAAAETRRARFLSTTRSKPCWRFYSGAVRYHSAFFLLANGIGLGVAWSLSVSARGTVAFALELPYRTAFSSFPPVLLGTSIGLAIGIQALKRLTGKTDRKIGAELASGLRYFCSVILPLLFVAALVEAFVTAALVAPR